MATTLNDVAREARCSIATASRALAHSPRINAETRRRVEEAAERIGYDGAGALRGRLRRQKTIGLVIRVDRASTGRVSRKRSQPAQGRGAGTRRGAPAIAVCRRLTVYPRASSGAMPLGC
jgi:LacI family transcriptional regulator